MIGYQSDPVKLSGEILDRVVGYCFKIKLWREFSRDNVSTESYVLMLRQIAMIPNGDMVVQLHRWSCKRVIGIITFFGDALITNAM